MTVGILSIITAAIQSSKVLIGLVDSFRGGPEEIRAISKDVQAFHSVISSINVTLTDKDIKTLINSDEALTQMVRNLEDPIRNCNAALGDLRLKVQKLLKPDRRDSGFRTNFTGIRWSLVTKGEMRRLHERLEATKSTLNNAWHPFNTYVVPTFLCMGED